jgi:hypothetical protein
MQVLLFRIHFEQEHQDCRTVLFSKEFRSSTHSESIGHSWNHELNVVIAMLKHLWNVYHLPAGFRDSWI